MLSYTGMFARPHVQVALRRHGPLLRREMRPPPPPSRLLPPCSVYPDSSVSLFGVGSALQLSLWSCLNLHLSTRPFNRQWGSRGSEEKFSLRNDESLKGRSNAPLSLHWPPQHCRLYAAFVVKTPPLKQKVTTLIFHLRSICFAFYFLCKTPGLKE